ncbi:response regulator [Azospirillum soli]|uniref:response regulator n=1 Tax=Azospirillum soli TaxID=1304799 RepID=UPI001FE4BCD4|nr:response regulator [Azospirillum soli]MBP2312226.1 CheY-like chemotaxis protein [Azospirillum soli]
MHESERARDKLVMVIDDERTVLQALNLLLEMWGYRVVVAESEVEAVERLSALDEKPHAILADYRLREGRTGVQAIERIRAMVGALVPGVIITGDTSIDGLRDARANGLTILQKPVLPPHLQTVLGKAVREASSGQAAT